MNISEEVNIILKKFTDKLVDINNYQSFISGIENWEKMMKDPAEYKKFFASSDLYGYLEGEEK